MFHSSPAFCLALFSAVVAPVASAQSEAMPEHQHHQHTSAPASLSYRSAFEGYRPFSDDTPVGWRDANEAVARQAVALSDPHAGHSMPMHKHGTHGMSDMSGMAPKKDTP